MTEANALQLDRAGRFIDADRLRTLLTVKEVAAYLRVSTATVYELCARGRQRHIRVLNAIRVPPCDLRPLVMGG
jgi:excisionase family DNA binding protein